MTTNKINESSANDSNEKKDSNTDYEASKLITSIDASGSAKKVYGNDASVLTNKTSILSKEIDVNDPNKIIDESIDSIENDDESSSDDSVGFFIYYFYMIT